MFSKRISRAKNTNTRNPIIESDLKHIIGHSLPWDQFKGKTFLITGATGFIASYIVETLLYLNEQKNGKPITVICLTRNKEKAEKKYLFYKNRKDIRFLIQDACDEIKLKENIDYIIHAASHATPSKFGIDPVGTLLPNVIGTYRLLEFAKKQKLQGFLFISSGEVYGNPPISMKTVKESYFGFVNPLSLRSCYAESKRMGENMCVSWLSQYNVPIKIVRLFHTYGPSMSLEDGRVHSDFVNNIIHHKNIVLRSDGRASRPFCYISDTVSGIFTVFLKGMIGEAYNIGNSKSVSINDLARALVALYPDKKLQIQYKIVDRGKKYLISQVQMLKLDISKMKAFGWKPKYSYKKGFKRTIDSYFV